RFARLRPGLHLPGGAPPGHGLVFLGGANLSLVHAGVEVPALVVLAGVQLAEVVELIQLFARLRRARRSRAAALGPFAGLFAGLEAQGVVGRLLLLLGARRLHANVGEARLVLKRRRHRPKCKAELDSFKESLCLKARSPRLSAKN